MKLHQFIGALESSGLEVHPEDVLDSLWLASLGRNLTTHAAEPVPIATQPHDKQMSGERESRTIGTDNPDPKLAGLDSSSDPSKHGRGESGTPPADPSQTGVYAKGTISPEDRTRPASPVSLPAGRALPNRLPLMRALRPLARRRPSPSLVELDEARTVELTAETAVRDPNGVLHTDPHPEFRPVPERWFHLDLVIEDDPGIGLWNETLYAFRQMLRETGAFRDVRMWRLRLAAETAPRASVYLEASTGGRVSPRALSTTADPRLILFATHGASANWINGRYATVLQEWTATASVSLLHLMPRHRWKRTPLGEPAGLCQTLVPGVANHNLEVEPFWWLPSADTKRGVKLPVTLPVPASLAEWAAMLMARSRRSPLYLRSTKPARTAKIPISPLMERPADFERAVGLLREASPEAYRLAVYLSPSVFTIPVARLVQEVKFGDTADQSHIADVLLSGLVFAHASDAPNTSDSSSLYFEFHPEAKKILMRSLRLADAQTIGNALEGELSQYLERVFGRSQTMAALIPDPQGKLLLPEWAAPFARVGQAMLGLVEAAKPVAASTDAAPAQKVAEKDPWRGARILWVDDHPGNNLHEMETLRERGAEVTTALSSEEGLVVLVQRAFDVILTDLSRGGNRLEGVDFLARLQANGIQTPVIVYAQWRGVRAPKEVEQAGFFGYADSAQRLYELILTALNESNIAATGFPTVSTAPVRNRYALLVGIDTYPGALKLRNCVNDVHAVYRLLGPAFQKTSVLTDEAATRDRILEAFTTMIGHAAPEDLCLLYYSGHATREEQGSAMVVFGSQLQPSREGLLFLDELQLLARRRGVRLLISGDAMPLPSQLGIDPPPGIGYVGGVSFDGSDVEQGAFVRALQHLQAAPGQTLVELAGSLEWHARQVHAVPGERSEKLGGTPERSIAESSTHPGIVSTTRSDTRDLVVHLGTLSNLILIPAPSARTGETKALVIDISSLGSGERVANWLNHAQIPSENIRVISGVEGANATLASGLAAIERSMKDLADAETAVLYWHGPATSADGRFRLMLPHTTETITEFLPVDQLLDALKKVGASNRGQLVIIDCFEPPSTTDHPDPDFHLDRSKDAEGPQQAALIVYTRQGPQLKGNFENLDISRRLLVLLNQSEWPPQLEPIGRELRQELETARISPSDHYRMWIVNENGAVSTSTDLSSQEQPQLTRVFRISGRVSGVGFRFFAQKAAEDLGLKGEAVNLRDGRIEVKATGTEQQLKQLEETLRRGPLGAKVEDVEWADLTGDPLPTGSGSPDSGASSEPSLEDLAWLSAMRQAPVLGRKRLIEWFRQFAQGEGPNHSLWLAMGPHGSGKSFTATILQDLARRTHPMRICYIENVGDFSPGSLAAHIAKEVDWGTPHLTPREDPMRLARAAAAWIAKQTRYGQETLIIIDGFDREAVKRDTREMIRQLIEHWLKTPTRWVGLVILGFYPYQGLEEIPQPESLGTITHEEVSEFLNRVFILSQEPAKAEQATSIASALFEGLSNPATHNGILQARLRQIIREPGQ